MISLKNLCIYYAIDHLETCSKGFEMLPRKLKTIFFEILCKRPKSALNHRVVKMLIHPDLQSIDLSNITLDNEVLKLVLQCKNLQKLNISDLNTSPEGIMEILKSPGVKGLRTFIAKNCKAVNDDVLHCLCENCEGLNVLDIQRCSAVTDRSAEPLKTLKLVGVNVAHTQITDLGVEEICLASSDTIEDINLMMCDVKPATMQKIFENCHKLHTCQCDSAIAGDSILQMRDFRQLFWTIK